MGRKPAALSNSGVYHIVFKGANAQDIFYGDDDRLEFLSRLQWVLGKYNASALAWALMDNHVHLVLDCGTTDPALLQHDLAGPYARSFNLRYGRVDPLFAERPFREGVEDQSYLYAVVRYVHWNRAVAGLAAGLEDRWTSYREVLAGEGIVDVARLLDVFGCVEEFVRFHESGLGGHDAPLARSDQGLLTDEQLIRYHERRWGGELRDGGPVDESRAGRTHSRAEEDRRAQQAAAAGHGVERVQGEVGAPIRHATS